MIHNLNADRKLLKPEVKLLVMVKAFGYGGGGAEISNLLQFHNVDCLGVAYTDGAVQLRNSGLTLPILVLNPDFDQIDPPPPHPPPRIVIDCLMENANKNYIQ